MDQVVMVPEAKLHEVADNVGVVRNLNAERLHYKKQALDAHAKADARHIRAADLL